MNQLSPFMLTNEWISKNKPCPHEEVNESIEKKKAAPFFTPKEKDTLFWIYYIIQNGWEKYETPRATSFENEKKAKFEAIEFLREKKKLLKDKKVKNLREDIEDELGNKPFIGMKTFMALCIASEKQIMFIHKKKCFDLCNDFDSASLEKAPYFVVHQHPTQTKYSLELDPTCEKIASYKKDYIAWESLDKPIKAFSSYKLPELIELCVKAGFTEGKDEGKEKEMGPKKTKKDYYEWLLTHI